MLARILIRCAVVTLTIVTLSDARANGAASTPLPVGLAGAVRGIMTMPGQMDDYVLDATAGSSYVIETFDVEQGDGGSAGTWLAAYGPDGEFLDRGTAGSNDADQSLLLVAPAGGPITIRVNGRAGWVGAYSLRAMTTRDAPGAAWDAAMEPDDWCQLATPLTPSAGPQLRAIAPREAMYITHFPDGDSFMVDLAVNRAYLVQVAGLPADAPTGAVGLSVSDETGDLIFAGAQATAGGVGPQLVIQAGPARSECVRVVGGRAANWVGGYTVDISELETRLFLPSLLGSGQP